MWAHTQPGEYCDPVTFKTFNENTHIVAIKVSGNVYEAETIERLNAKTKNWRDLLSDEPFTRKDIIDLHVRPGLGARAGGMGGDEDGKGDLVRHELASARNGVSGRFGVVAQPKYPAGR